jgi:hypothetical protein
MPNANKNHRDIETECGLMLSRALFENSDWRKNKMQHNSEVYDRLEQKYHLVGDRHSREILETLMTPDEGEIILELSAPMTPAELAGRMNRDKHSLNTKKV